MGLTSIAALSGLCIYFIMEYSGAASATAETWRRLTELEIKIEHNTSLLEQILHHLKKNG